MASPGLERTPSRGSSGGRSPLNMSQFEVKNKYHSQGLAAGGSALLDAINRGKVHLAKFILDAAGEDDVVNTRDFKGKTPLIRACYIKEEKTRGKAIELLLEKGADVNIQDDSERTVLSYACELRCNDVVKMLVKNNVDPDISDIDGNTALTHSAMVGNDMAIEILIKSFRRLGLQVDHVNHEGLTALLIAAKNGFIECASILALDGKACISFRDREQGLNAEEWARVQGCSTPEVLPFSTQAYRYCRFSDNSTRGESGQPTAGSSSSGQSKALLTVSSPSKQGQKHEKGRRMSQIPPRMVEQKNAPGKIKRGSLPTIKFTGLFSTKQVNSDNTFSVGQLKNDVARKQSPKGSHYSIKDSKESPRSGNKTTRPRSAGSGSKTQKIALTNSTSTKDGSPQRKVRTTSQSEMHPAITINSKPHSASSFDSNKSLECENSIGKLSLVDCPASQT